MFSITSHARRSLATAVLIATLVLGTLAFSHRADAQINRELMLAQIQQLLETIKLLQAQLAQMHGSSSPEGGFDSQHIAVGSRIITSALLRVRAGASVNANWVNNIGAGVGGTVVDGPRYADGYTWWHINYNNGTSGWSAENWLRVISTPAQTTSVYQTSSSASCSITTDKTSYLLGETIKISWTSSNAKEVRFVPEPEKDYLDITNRTRNSSGSMKVDASVIGNPVIVLRATDAEGRSVDCSRTVNIKSPSVRVTVDGFDTTLVTPNPEDTLDVFYYPLGNIESCRISGYYDDGKYSVSHDWNQWIFDNMANNSGRATFRAVMTYKTKPLGPLESLSVTCDVKNGNSIGKNITVKVQDSGERKQFRFNYKGDDTTTAGNVTRTQAFDSCYEEVDRVQYSSMPEDGNTVQCYWGGSLIYTQDSWKG
jgi:hypothetical protein